MPDGNGAIGAPPGPTVTSGALPAVTLAPAPAVMVVLRRVRSSGELEDADEGAKAGVVDVDADGGALEEDSAGAAELEGVDGVEESGGGRA